MSTINKKAKKAIDIIMAASKSGEPSKHFGREFDNIFENGNGSDLVNEIVRNYLVNPDLQNAVARVDHWIGIDGWLEHYYKTNARTLF